MHNPADRQQETTAGKQATGYDRVQSTPSIRLDCLCLCLVPSIHYCHTMSLRIYAIR